MFKLFLALSLFLVSANADVYHYATGVDCAAGSNGQVYTTNGTTCSFQDGGGGGGVSTVGTFSASAQTDGATIATSTITFGPASATVPGMVGTAAQSWAGVKTFTAVRIVLGANGNMAVSDSTALANRTSAVDVTCMGAGNACNNLTSGNLNTSFGWGNMTGTITGANNTTIGVGNLTSLTSGSGNFSGGYVSLAACSSCSENIAIGTSSMGNCTTSGCTNNVCIGANACATANGISTGSNITALGASTCQHGGIGTYSICIGSGADVSSTIVSNELVIGGSGGGIKNAVIGAGWTNSTNFPVTLKTTGGSGSNSVGANFTIQPGAGTGTGVGGDFIIQVAAAGSTGSTANTAATRLRVYNAGNVTVGAGTLATTATDGFVYIPTSAGLPTGVPTSISGYLPMEVDTTNHKLCVFEAAAWHCITLP